ncbi:tyrosine--tRNA ligase [Brevibacillus sp. VP]|uniref:tyrosine--tRNA ligase n=1 Tax=unclassified Brevibacillus TaxID=2684853 RepID=UPI000E2FE9E9|nr:tyrosine--tRNA ligase [Brevibacillus sp. VP]RFB33366.1 tyrosine--tRNA ligase [Brevibacillus sp. VP]
MDIIQELESRGLIYQSTDKEELTKRLQQGKLTLYTGFDPTADSLHIGHLLPILTLRRFQQAGHQPIALVGGGTGMIGDPSGRSTERSLNTEEVVKGYSDKLKSQLERFLDFDRDGNPAIMANNYDWLGQLTLIEFLRDIGKHFSINYMLAKDSVSARLENGISFTEFSYMIMQAYDFWKLNQTHNCELQMGGSDQWGNITAGTEFIRRANQDDENQTEAKKVFGLTLPLVLKSDGTKFGKTAGGAVWLDASKTSPYKFYQFWLNTDDRDVVKFLKYFTFLSMEELNALENAVATEPEKREAQRTLAREVTSLVHGEAAMKRAEEISVSLFNGGLKELTPAEIADSFSDVPSTTLEDGELTMVDVLVQVGAAKSKRESREYLNNNAITVNDVRFTDLETKLADIERLGSQYLVIRRGKKNYYLVEYKG